MMYRLNDDGQVVNEKGDPLEVNGEPVKVTGAQTEDQVNSLVQERLARQKAKLDEQIRVLQSQAEKTPELERMLEASKAELAEVTTNMQRAKEQAESEVATQLEAANRKAQQALTDLQAERQARTREQVTNAILAEAKDRFIDPASDIVPKLLGVHKREPVKSPDGKPVEGQFVDTFKVSYENEKGEKVDEHMGVSDALKVIEGKQEFQHYLRASGSGGSGGGASFVNVANLNRSSMSPADKAAFVGKHGLDQFKALPE